MRWENLSESGAILFEMFRAKISITNIYIYKYIYVYIYIYIFKLYKTIIFLISSFRRVLYVVCFLLGNYPASGFYVPTFRNTLSVPSS